MQVVANSAIKAQLSTLPRPDQERTDWMLQKLADDFEGMRPNLRMIDKRPDLWELKITPRLRALVRVVDDRIVVLAVTRTDQLERYLKQRVGG